MRGEHFHWCDWVERLGVTRAQAISNSAWKRDLYPGPRGGGNRLIPDTV